MKFGRTSALAAGLASAALLLSACGGGSSSEDSDFTITAGFYPLAWVSEQVAGDAWAVDNLTAPGGDPHELSIGLGATAALQRADLVVISSGLQPQVDSTVATVAEGDVLDAVDYVDLVPAEDHELAHLEDHEGHNHAEEGDEEHADENDAHAGHDHGHLDPHFWHDPLRMASLADAVAEQLSEIDPAGATGYAERAADLRTSLESLDADFTSGLASCTLDLVVVSHDAFGYLTKYGIAFAPIAGLSPDAEASPADLGRLQNLIKTEKITTVFSERLASAKMAETLAKDLGITTAVLDPIEGLDAETADEDYLSLMRANLDALRKANGCS